MKKAIIALGVLLVLAVAVPAMAQGPFADVPTDHWAYQAVNSLQNQGILIGYPDGTFQGKRAITRYEFAVAVARMVDILRPGAPLPSGVSQADFDALRNRVQSLEGRPAGQQPAAAPQVTREEFQSLQRLVNEFRDELAALGVDVDALRRDMAALTERVQAIESKLDRFQVSGNVNAFAIAPRAKSGEAFDRDNRYMWYENDNKTLSNVGFVFDGDLNIKGRLSPKATANATINYGNYLNYIWMLDDFVIEPRPTRSDYWWDEEVYDEYFREEVFPYYANVNLNLGSADLTVGRQPLQFTPYTLKMIDVDTYTSIEKTSSGDYPVDGATLNWNLGKVALTGYAAKHNSNRHLRLGLASQADSGLYFEEDPFHVLGGYAAGGLDAIDQSAGVRAILGTPLGGNLGLTYMRIAGLPTGMWDGEEDYEYYDQVNVFGADFQFNWKKFNIAGEYAQTNTLNAESGPDIKRDNKAWDAKLGTNFGRLGLDVGYKSVERNFAAPGYWDRLGRWANPTNIRGPYFGLNVGLSDNLKLSAGGAFYSGVDNFEDVVIDKDIDVQKGTVGLKWGLSSAWSLNADAEVVRYKGDFPRIDEAYYTFGASWQITPSAGLKLAYQIVDYDTGANEGGPYGDNYKGNMAVAEFGVKF